MAYNELSNMLLNKISGAWGVGKLIKPEVCKDWYTLNTRELWQYHVLATSQVLNSS